MAMIDNYVLHVCKTFISCPPFKYFWSGGCTGLTDIWIRRIETAAEFPVDPGTVVEVTCSYPEAINEGSKEVTCISGESYNYEMEPSCKIAGE